MSTEEDLEAVERESATLIAIETWKASAELRINVLERDTSELRNEVRMLRAAADRRASLGSLSDAAEEAEKGAILRALKESRLDHEKSRKRLALQNLVAFIVIVAGIVLRTVLFGGH